MPRERITFVLVLLIPLSLAFLTVGLEVFNFLVLSNNRQRIDEYRSRNGSSGDTLEQQNLSVLVNRAKELMTKSESLQKMIDSLGLSHLEGTAGIRRKLEDILEVLHQIADDDDSTQAAETNGTIIVDGCTSQTLHCTPVLAQEVSGNLTFSECQTQESNYLEGEVVGESTFHGMVDGAIVGKDVRRYCTMTGLNNSVSSDQLLDTFPAVGSTLVLTTKQKWSCVCHGLLYRTSSPAPLRSYTCNFVVTTCNQRKSVSL